MAFQYTRFWKENLRQGDRTCYYVEANADREGLSVAGTFQGSAQHGDYVVGTVRLFYEALHTGTLHLKFEVGVDVPTGNNDFCPAFASMTAREIVLLLRTLPSGHERKFSA